MIIADHAPMIDIGEGLRMGQSRRQRAEKKCRSNLKTMDLRASKWCADPGRVVGGDPLIQPVIVWKTAVEDRHRQVGRQRRLSVEANWKRRTRHTQRWLERVYARHFTKCAQKGERQRAVKLF